MGLSQLLDHVKPCLSTSATVLSLDSNILPQKFYELANSYPLLLGFNMNPHNGLSRPHYLKEDINFLRYCLVYSFIKFCTDCKLILWRRPPLPSLNSSPESAYLCLLSRALRWIFLFCFALFNFV